MTTRKRDDDRPHDDRYKLWPAQDKLPNRDNDRRRQRSATIPAQPQNPQDTRRSSRAYRHEPHYTTAAPSASYQAVPGPSSSRAPHPPRSSAQIPSTGYHIATHHPTSIAQHSQVPPSSKVYPLPTPPPRRDNNDSKSYSNRRGQTVPIPKASYNYVSTAEDLARTSKQPYPSRPAQPIANVITPSVNWVPSAQDVYAKRSTDRDKERDRYREERDRERNAAERERDRYRERYKSDARREKERIVESARHKEQSRFRSEKRMESDSESLLHPDNSSKVSLSGREGYQSSIRESSSGHRRHRTEDGLLSSTARRPQHIEPSHNPTPVISMQSTGSQAVAAATGSSVPGVGSNPPPAPRVMPVYLPQKPQKSHHEQYPSSAAHGGQSSSDAERASVKHRMERNHSGAAVQRGDPYVSSVVRERQGQEGPADTRPKPEAKYSTSAYYNPRQPLQQSSVNTVDIPLITPGFNSSPLPHESRGHVGTIPILVAGEGPADHQAHNALSKPQTASRREELQDAKYPHASHPPVSKPPLGRSQSSEVPHSRSEVPPVDRSRTDPAVVDVPYAPQKYPNVAMEHQSSEPRSAHQISLSNPPGGPRPQPTSSYVGHQGESTRPVPTATPLPSPMARAPSNQPSAPPLTAQRTNSSTSKIGLTHGSLPSTYSTTGTSQPHLPGTHGNTAPSIKRSPSTPPTHSAPINNTQAVMNAPQLYARHAPHSSDPSSRPSPDRPESHDVAPRMTTTQMTNGSTVKSSWVVQTTTQADISLKNGYSTKEEKYSPRNGPHQPVEPHAVTHPQLREVLSQDNHYSSRVPSTAQSRATSTQGSPRRSDGAPKDSYAGTRRTPDHSPHMSKVKEAPTPDLRVPPFPPPVLEPPRIAVIGATPSSMNEELPPRSNYNTGLLVPSYSAPSRVSRTTSSSSEYQTRPQITRNHSATSTASQQSPQIPLPPVAPQAPQLQLSSSYASNADGQYSPPPLPIPPPRMPGVDIAEDIFSAKLSSINPTGIYPPPPSPIVPLQHQPTQTHTSTTPAPTPSLQPSPLNGHADSNKNKPRAGEETPYPGPAVSRETTAAAQVGASISTPSPAHVSGEASVTAPVGASMLTPSPARVTDSANGANQGIQNLQHPLSSQGTSTGSQPSAPAAPQLKRPKVTIEVVPESPMFMNKWPATPSPSYPQIHVPTQSSEVPAHSSSVPAAKPQPSQASTPGSTPPSKPKDVSVRPPPTPIPSTPSYALPTPSTQHQAAPLTQQHTLAPSRPPYSAPPMKTSFSSSYADTLHHSTFGSQLRGYQRPVDTQQSAKILPTPTGGSIATAQAARSASQPLNVPQSNPLDATSTRGKPYSATPTTTTTATAPLSAAEAYAKFLSSRPLVSASSVAAAQSIRPAAQAPNAQTAPLDTASKGRQYPLTSAATAAVSAPQPQSLPTVETQTNPLSSRPIASTSATTTQATRPELHPLNATQGAPSDPISKGRQQVTANATTGASHPQSLPGVESSVNYHSSRPIIPPVTIPHGPSARAAAGTTSAKSQLQDAPIPNDPRRGLLSSASRYASTVMNPIYPTTHRHPPPPNSTQQSNPPPSAYSNSHHRTVSLPQSVPTSNTNPRPPSPRKASQPLVNPTTTPPQPFPTTSSQANAPSRSAKAAEPSRSTRVAVSGHPSTPAPSRAHLPPAVNRTLSHESEVLLTPSSIAPSMPKTPQMNFNSVSQATAPAMRQRQASTESRESKKKPGGFFGGLLRTMSGSARPLESPIVPSPGKTFIGMQRSPKAAAPPIQQSKSSSSVKEKDKTTAPVPTFNPKAQTQPTPNPLSSMSAQPQMGTKVKPKVRIPDPVPFPPQPPHREHKQAPSTSVFSQFMFLTSKRKRTVSGASIDVCDGSNTANTAIGSPNVSQSYPLPPMPPIRDPMVATSEWRDKAEAEQQKRKKNRFRPGVTFDVEEDVPDPGRQKGARLVRRKSGRGSATPAPRSKNELPSV